MGEAYLLLRIRPPRDLHNHVQHRLLLIGIERDVVERRARHAILLDIDAVLERMGGTDLAGGEFGCRAGVVGAAGGQRLLGHVVDVCRLSGVGGGREMCRELAGARTSVVQSG